MKKIFDPQPTLTRADGARLLPHMASWRKLNELLVMDTVTTDDLKRMVLIELRRSGCDDPRSQILKKLLGRIARREARKLKAHWPL